MDTLEAIWNGVMRFWNGIVKPILLVFVACWLTITLAGMPISLTLAACLALIVSRRGYWPRVMKAVVAVYVLALVAMIGGRHWEMAAAHLMPVTHDAFARRWMNTDLVVGKKVDPENLGSNIRAEKARRQLLRANRQELQETINKIVQGSGSSQEKTTRVDEAVKKARQVEDKLGSLGDDEVVGQAGENWGSWIKTGWHDFWRSPTTEWPILKPDQEIVRDLQAGDRICFSTRVNCHTDDTRQFTFIDNSTGRRYDPLTQATEIATLPPTTYCWEGGPSGNHLTFRRL